MNAVGGAHPATLLAPGTMVAGYRIEGMLGHGGMGVVYEATQISLNRTVALKLLAAHLSDDPVFRERFRREGVVQARLDHPNIVTVHEAGESDFGLFLAMRLVRGPRLKDLILAGTLDARRSLSLLEPIADALDTAHTTGLVHRDVKPQNILVGARNQPYLADFGLTKLTGDHSLTASGDFVGTLDYISPEQITGARPTAHSDVYAFGAMLYECLTGAVPFPGDNHAAVVYGHLTDPPPRVSERHPELPRMLDDVVARALAKDPRERYDSASEVIAETREAFGSDVPPVRPPARRAAAADDDPTVLAGDASAAAWTSAPLPRPGAGEATTTHLRRGPLRVARGALGLLAIALLAAVGGAIAGRPGEVRTVASRSSAGRLELAQPDGWRQVRVSQPVRGIAFTKPVELVAPGSGGASGIIVGEVRSVGPTLLPAAFVRGLRRPPASAVRVALGRHQALRYSNLEQRRSTRRLTVYAVPDSRGVATVVCFDGSRAPAAPLQSCERVAATLRVSGVATYPVEPSPKYGKAIAAAVAPLAAGQPRGRRALARAERPAGQARAAAGLARLYELAARKGRAFRAPQAARRAHRALIGALRRSGDAYARMATAIVASNRRRFGRAVHDVKGGEADRKSVV